jgi:hypothetical protein
VREIPHIEVYDEAVPDEAHLPLIPGTDAIVPHVTVSFGGAVKGSRQNDGIAGARLNGSEMDVVIRAVGNNPDDCRKLSKLVDDKLLGFAPTNCGEIDYALYGSVGAISGLAQPTRYASVQSYSLVLNSDRFAPE